MKLIWSTNATRLPISGYPGDRPRVLSCPHSCNSRDHFPRRSKFLALSPNPLRPLRRNHQTSSPANTIERSPGSVPDPMPPASRRNAAFRHARSLPAPEQSHVASTGYRPQENKRIRKRPHSKAVCHIRLAPGMCKFLCLIYTSKLYCVLRCIECLPPPSPPFVSPRRPCYTMSEKINNLATSRESHPGTVGGVLLS